MTDVLIPSLEFLLLQLGKAGRRLSDIGAAEGAAGNLSICVNAPLEVGPHFKDTHMIELPVLVPRLAGCTLILTGSGCRVREILDAPEENLACIVVSEDGRMGNLLTAPNRGFSRPTSELGSHLAVHDIHAEKREKRIHAVIHAQPVHLTYLSHIPRYQDQAYLNSHLMRWQGETIVSLPEGMGVLPFSLPNTAGQLEGTAKAMRNHRLIVWSRHGVLARSENSVFHALDLIEYAETAARYEYLNLTAGEQADGLSREQLRGIAGLGNVQQTIF